MTPTQQQAIERAARQAAVAALSGWPVVNPYPSESDAAKEWERVFQDGLRSNQKGFSL